MRTPIKYRLWRAWVAAAVLAAAAGPAPAFYWSLKPQPTLIPPGEENKPGNPPLPGSNPIPIPSGQPPDTPGGPGSPGSGPGGPPSGPPGTPGSVPEPATGVAGLIGLAVIAGRRWLRKK